MLALVIVFMSDKDLIINSVNADVAGMDYYDLRTDYDFKKAVRYIIESCDITGHVDDDYLYSSSISC